MKIKKLLIERIEWREVPGWPKYEVSNTGKVRIAETGSKVAQWDHQAKGGVYKRVTLRDKGKRKNFRVHRLVAMAFLPNPDYLPEVDHLDHDTFNNHVSNLEWVRSSENLERRRSDAGSIFD